MSDEELAGAAGVPLELVPALRGARDLVEARDFAGQILEPAAGDAARGGAADARALPRARRAATARRARTIVRELKAVGGDLKALRLALTGARAGPELWAVIHALPRDEALRRVDAAL